MTDWKPWPKRSPYLDRMGPFWQRESDGFIETGLVLEEKHCNARGLAHGSLIATLCDMVLGHNIASRPESPGRYLTTSLSIDYLASARVGERLTVLVDRVRAGNTLGFAQAIVLADGRWIPIARATAEKHAGVGRSFVVGRH